MKRKLTVGALIGLMAGAQPALAQTASEEADQGGIKDIVVTARRVSESIQHTPVAVTALSPAEIDRNNIKNMTNLQQVTPSLSFAATSYDPFSAYITIRGHSATDLLLVLEPAVGVYIDGIYRATPHGTSVGDLFDVDRVEVLKGPQGTLYGRNSTGGAISVYGRLPDYSRVSGEGKVALGNFDMRELDGVLNLPLVEDKAALRVVGSYVHRRGYGNDVLRGTHTGGFDKYNFRGALRLNLTEKLEVLLRADYARGSSTNKVIKIGAIQPRSFDTIQAALELGLITDPAIFNDPAALAAVQDQAYAALLAATPTGKYDVAPTTPIGTHFWQIGTSATINYDLGGSTLRSITGYRSLRSSFLGDPDGTPFRLIYTPNEDKEYTRFRQFTQEFQISGTAFDKRLTYVGGLFYYRGNGREVQEAFILPALIAINPSLTDVNVVNKSYAVYGQASYNLTDKLRVTGGARFTHEDKLLISHNTLGVGPTLSCQVPPPATLANCEGRFRTKFDNFSYTAGLDYQINPQAMVYAKAGRGFRAGGTNERGTAVPGSYAAFRPETVQSYELGLKTDLFNRSLRINLAAYHSIYNGLQRGIIINGNTSIIANTDPTGRTSKTLIDGIEAEVTARPISQLLLRAAYAYTDGRFAKRSIPAGDVENLLQNVPKHNANASATYTVPTSVGPVELTASYAYLSKVDYAPYDHGGTPFFGSSATSQKGYGLLDARISLHLEQPDVRVAAWAKNLTNRFYYSGAIDLTGAGVGHTVRFIGEPRTWGLEVSKRF